MSSTNAERQRRYRAHKAGDHSLCDPGRDCRAGSGGVTSPVTVAVTQQAVTPSPSGLGTRGRRLWRETIAAGPELNPREQVVLEEACRTADRLDRLHRMLEGDDTTWARFRVGEDGAEVTVVLNNPLAEVRQQQTTLARLLAELRTSRAGAAGGANPGATRRAGTGVSRSAASAGKEGGGVVADLAAWVAGRSTPAAG